MAYQDDFRNKVLQALKAKNLAVDISQEATQQAIVEEAQNVAAQESRPMSPEEMKLVLQDVSRQLAAENQQFTAQSADFAAFYQNTAGGPGGSYSGGGIAQSVMNKDILIIPTAGTATSINTLSQIDFKIISNPNAYGVIDPNEVKSSFYNWGERITGNTFDTPVLGLGGAWGGVSYTPTSQWGIGGSQGSGVGASTNPDRGFGQIIYFKPATSTIYASLFNDLGINADYPTRSFTLTGYNSAVPGAFPTSGFAVTFGGIGNSGGLIIAGAANSTQINTVKFLSSLTVSNSTATDTLQLGMSSQAFAGGAQSVFYPGGTAQTSNIYVLSAQAPSFSLGDIFYAAGSGHTTLARLSVQGPNQYLTTVGGVPAWTNTIAANTVSVNAAGAGSTVLYPLLNNAAGAGSAVSTDIDFSVDPGLNLLKYGSGSFYVGTAVSSPTYTGSTSLAIKPGANATTAIALQKADGTNILVVDSTNNLVGINKTPSTYALDVSGDANVGSGNVYRINGTQVLSSTQVFGVTVSSSVITSGSWSATAITAQYGGTGLQTPFVVGDLLYANSLTTWSRLAAAAAGSFLISNGTSAAPQYVAGSGVSVGLLNITANTVNADNYITFTYNTGGVGLSISNQASQLTYNPGTQQFKVPFITGTAFTATNLTGTILTATQPNITSASSLATVGQITGGNWNAASIGLTYGGTGSNLGPGASVGNSNRIIVTGNTGSYASSLIDNATSGYLLVSGGSQAAPTFTNTSAAALTFTGGVAFNTVAATSNVTPSNPTDLVNKSYADSISAGLDPHASVRVATIAGIAGSYRQAGVAGTSTAADGYIISTAAGLISADPGFDTVSGTALTAGQRVLVWYGINGGIALTGSGTFSPASAFTTTFGSFGASYIANGIYTITTAGSATSNWILTRASDTYNNTQLTGGTFTFVEEGTNYADTGFVDTNDTTSLGPIGFGNTQITWSPFSGAGSLNVSQGLSRIGNTLAVNYNITTADAIVTNLSKGFSIGGARTGSVGSSSYDTFTFTGSNSTYGSATLTVDNAGFTLAGGETAGTSVPLSLRGLNFANTITGNTDGWTHSGGQTSRTLTVIGGNILLNGGGFGLTLSSNAVLSLNGNTLTVAQGSSNITFQSASASGYTANTTQYLVQNGQAQYVLSTNQTTFGVGDIYYGSGTAYTSLARLALGGTGASVLIRNATVPVWGTIALASSDYVSGILGLSNGGTNANLTASNGGVVYSTASAFAILSGTATAGLALVSGANAAPSWSVLSLAGGGTSNTIAGTAVSYQIAQYNSSGSAISSIALPTANNSVLIAATPTSVAWSNGPLGITYGGTNASSFTNTNGAVIYNGSSLATATGTTITSGVGISVVGTINSSGGFFIGGNSVVSSIAGLYGAVTVNSASSNGGTSYLSTSGQSVILNYPGTGITGTGSVTQVAYYNANRELTGSTGLIFSPTAVSGNGLSININSTTGNIFKIDTPVAMTAGNLIDADVNGTQRFGVDWKGMATHTATGNTALVIVGGRTVLAPVNSNYASLNFGNTNATPGAGLGFTGDLWFNGTNLYFRKSDNTNFDLLVGSVSGAGVADKVAKWSTGTGLTYANLTESPSGVGMTISSANSITTTSSLLTLQSIATDDNKTDRYFIRGMSTGGSATTRYFSIDTAGNLRATTKSFDIPHPTKEGFRLVYGVLEGPEHGVYHRGTVEGKGIVQVDLPDYWHKLVGNQYTIQLTPWGNYNVGIGSKTENYFTIQLVGDAISRKFKNIKVDYIVHGSRIDAPLDIEQ